MQRNNHGTRQAASSSKTSSWWRIIEVLVGSSKINTSRTCTKARAIITRWRHHLIASFNKHGFSQGWPTVLNAKAFIYDSTMHFLSVSSCHIALGHFIAFQTRLSRISCASVLQYVAIAVRTGAPKATQYPVHQVNLPWMRAYSTR